MALSQLAKLPHHLAGLRKIAGGGGPSGFRLARVGAPHGLVVPRSEVVVEVKARDGAKARFDAEVPLPFALGWSIRGARLLLQR